MFTSPEPFRISFMEPGNYEALKLIKFHDFLFFFLLFISIFVFIIMIIILLNYNVSQKNFQVKYANFLSGKILHHPHLEFIWTVVPTLILINMAVPTFGLLYNMDLIIDPKINLKVIGNQWYWQYESSDFLWAPQEFGFDSYMVQTAELSKGERRLLEVDNFLVLPTSMEIRLLITAKDVLHSFALPSLGVKLDACPGRLNSTSINFKIPGTYIGQCSELCGPNHGFMPINITSLPMEAGNIPVLSRHFFQKI